MKKKSKEFIVAMSAWIVYIALLIVPFAGAFYGSYLLSDNSPIKPGFVEIRNNGWPEGQTVALLISLMVAWCFAWFIAGLYFMDDIGKLFSWMLRIPKDDERYAKA